jgi:hypothetical protein
MVSGSIVYALTPAQTTLLDRMQRSLQTQGAKQTIQLYFACDGTQNGYELIASGEPAGIKLAIELLPSADGCFAESLNDAVARALQRQPESVLPFFKEALQPSTRTCIPMMIEVPPVVAEATLKKTEDALRSVKRPELQAPRDACLQEVSAYREAGVAAQRYCEQRLKECERRRAGGDASKCAVCPDIP